jgi:Domain of unknown function (DUF4170)
LRQALQELQIGGTSTAPGHEGSAMAKKPKQLLHLVFGGELTALDEIEFKDLDKLDMVGIYPNYATAYAAWKAKAQQTVDNAEMRYFIVHLHRLLQPDGGDRRPR